VRDGLLGKSELGTQGIVFGGFESLLLGDNPISFNFWEGFPGRFDLSPLILRLKGFRLGFTLPTCLANARVDDCRFGRGSRLGLRGRDDVES
jgi:hypothetical protein